MSFTFNDGYNNTLKNLGIEKIAVRVLPGAPLTKRIGQWFRKKMPTKAGVGEFMVGSPRRFGEEISSGKALGKNSLIRQSFHAPGALNKALFYGIPAAETASIATGDSPNKGKRIGETLGGAALGLGAWKPLGLLGAIGAGELGSRAGGLLGGTAEHLIN